MTTIRRRYFAGTCDDGCYDAKRVTWVAFWVNGYRMKLCARCVRNYGKLLMRGNPPQKPCRCTVYA